MPSDMPVDRTISTEELMAAVTTFARFLRAAPGLPDYEISSDGRVRHLLWEFLMDRITTKDELFTALDELVQAIDNPEVFTDEMSVQIFWERGRAHWEA